MKTQLTKPSRTKARYTEEYKQEALELWRADGEAVTMGVTSNELKKQFSSRVRFSLAPESIVGVLPDVTAR